MDESPPEFWELTVLRIIAESRKDSYLLASVRIAGEYSRASSPMQVAAVDRAVVQCRAELERWRTTAVPGSEFTREHLTDLHVHARKAMDWHASRTVEKALEGGEVWWGPREVCRNAWNLRAARLARSAGLTKTVEKEMESPPMAFTERGRSP